MKILLITLAVITVVAIALSLVKAKVELYFGETKKVVIKLPGFKLDTSELKKENRKKKKTRKEKEKLLFFTDFCEIAGKVIRVFNRKLVIRTLKSHILVATDDAAKTALAFGKVSAGVNIICGAICNNFKVIERDISINADFTKQKTVYDIYVNLELSLLGSLAMLFSAGVCAVRAIIKNKKNKAV